MAKKAYVISCHDDDHGSDVVFAETAKAARQRGNGDMCDCGYIELSARRATELDQYAETGVTMKLLATNHGWYALCQCCERQVFGDEHEAIWADGDNRVYCSRKCLEKDAAFWRGHTNCPQYLMEASSQTPKAPAEHA